MGAAGGAVASFGPLAATNNSALAGTVTSLLNFNGSNGATSTTDLAGKAWTFYGDAKLSTAQKKYGTASLLLDGSGDYLTSPNSADFSTANADDITIACWVYYSAIGTKKAIATKRPSSGTVHEWQLGAEADGSLSFTAWNSSTAVVSFTGATNLPASAWHHVAVTRQGGVWRLFANGALDATAAQTEAPSASAAAVHIGRDPSRTSFGFDRDFNGYIDDMRVTKGLARYTAAFIPPTYELTMPV
jgi:hypothetical protein